METKKREVLQLLKDYRAFHTPYGGSDGTINLEAMGQYGPAGYVEAGAEFREYRCRLTESYRSLEAALILLKGEDFDLWLVLKRPYLGDPADPSVVDDWRGKAARNVERAEDIRGVLKLHDRAIERLSEMLSDADLFVIFPKRMTSREAEQVDRRNKEVFDLYRSYRYVDKLSRNKAIEKAAIHCGYSRSRAYEIVCAGEIA